MITLAQAQASRALRIAGTVPTSPDFIQLLNDATRTLLKRGDWVGSIQFVTTCVYNRTVTWNRYVGTVLGLHVGHHHTIPLNYWHDWTYPGDVEANRRWSHWKRHGCGEIHTVAIGNSPVFQQPNENEPVYIQIFPTNQNDCGKTITWFGLDSNFQPVITNQNGYPQQGEPVTLKLPYAITTKQYRRIDRVVKDKTLGRLNCFGFDPLLSLNTPISIYEPDETTPSYEQSQIPHWNRCPGQPQLVTAMVKVKFVEVSQPDDLVQIDNLDALAIAMQAIKASDAYDHAGAETGILRAVRDLNYELRDKYPLEQTTVSFRPFGTAMLQKHFLGMR